MEDASSVVVSHGLSEAAAATAVSIEASASWCSSAGDESAALRLASEMRALAADALGFARLDVAARTEVASVRDVTT